MARNGCTFEESEVSVLMDGLLWELSERGIDFVDRKKLMTAFSGTISAAKEEYPKLVEQHKTLIATDWGVDPEYAFREPLDDLDILTSVPRHAQQTIDRQERELSRIKAVAASGQARQELSESERLQLERLKSEKRGELRTIAENHSGVDPMLRKDNDKWRPKPSYYFTAHSTNHQGLLPTIRNRTCTAACCLTPHTSPGSYPSTTTRYSRMPFPTW